jgi:SAM-dependent methyltransferase
VDVPEAGRRYERIGGGYGATRRTDPRIAARVETALGDARTVVNVGAGSGSYEPAGREVTAIEPSATMAAQRPASLPPATIARAEALPLDDDSVDAAMAVLTVHHWDDPAKGIEEMRRVARDRVVVLTFDPEVISRAWIRDYAPEMRELDAGMPPIAELTDWLDGAEVEAIPSRNDCQDLFLETLLGRPELILDPVVRANTSAFARLSDEAEARAVDLLAADLASGRWDREHGHLRGSGDRDGGMRLLISNAVLP